MIDLTGVDLSGVMTGITDMLPVVLPVLIGFIGIRKAIAFLMGALKKA